MSPVHAPALTCATTDGWALSHTWQAESDRSALALTREVLGRVGIDLVDARDGAPPSAVKMHAMEMADALHTGSPRLQDLSAVAQAAGWAGTLPHFVQRTMRRGAHWHGIPVGIHRANLCWVHAPAAARFGSWAQGGVREFFTGLEHARRLVRHPLAVGAEAWQIGVLFETVLLAVAGRGAYLRTFVQMRPSVWREPDVQAAIACLMRLRRLVDDQRLHLGWQDQLSLVQRGEAIVQVMGDWARAAAGAAVVEQAFPGTQQHFVAIADFFVPVGDDTITTAGPVAQRVAMALTEPGFQQRFAHRKGCMPALRTAWAAVDPRRAALLECEADVLPSWTFDQCCSVRWKSALMHEVAQRFVQHCEPRQFIDHLCQWSGTHSLQKETP